MKKKPIVIAHRGASGYRPEHTLAGYELAIDQGADFIEPDLVMTRDGVLIARHDNVLDLTTDIAQRPELAQLRTTKTVDGIEVADSWFSEDLTYEQVRTLRAVERIPAIRPKNTQYDGQFSVPRLEEILELVARKEKETGRRIGIYPETKHPTHFAERNLAMEQTLVETLAKYGYSKASDPVFLQSFEVSNLKWLKEHCDLPRVQLMWLTGGPFDVQAAGGEISYDQMATARGLEEISKYADAVGPEKNHFLIPLDDEGNLDPSKATSFVRDAHEAGLLVHPFTFRAENVHLPANYREGSEHHDRGNLVAEIRVFLEMGIDGYFTDQADLGVQARDAE